MATDGTVEIFKAGIKKEINEVKSGLQDVLSKILEINKANRVSSKPLNVKGINGLRTQTEANAKAVKNLNSQLSTADRLNKKLLNSEKALEDARSKTNKQIIKNRLEVQQLNKKNKEEAILNSKNSSLIQKITILRRREVRIIQDLNAKKELGNKLSLKEQRQLKKSTRAFDKYNKAIKVAKHTTGQFQENVGNYPKQLQAVGIGLKKLIPLVSVGLLLREGFNFAKEARQFAIDAKGVEFAYKRLGKTGEETFNKIKASTRGLLSDLDIKKTINEFDNFNLKLEDMNTLMEFASVRSAQTGTSIEFMLDSLKEGLSKGSLRRLDNLGISISAMKKEMKDFGLTVQEAFTKLAGQEVKRAGSILDDAANAQAKWNADLKNFKLLVGNSFIAKASDSFYTLGSNILRAITPTKSLTEKVQEEQLELNILVDRITDANIKQEDRLNLITQLQKKYPFFLKNLDKEKITNKDLAIELDKVNDLYIKRIALQSQEDRISKILDDAGKTALKNSRDRIELSRELSKINLKNFNNELDLSNKTLEQRFEIVKSKLEENAVTVKLNQKGQTSQNTEAKLLDILNYKSNILKSNSISQNKINDSLISEQELTSEIEKDLGITLSQLNKIFGVRTKINKTTKNQVDGVTDITNTDKAKKDYFDLAQFKLQTEIKFNDEIVKDDKATLNERLNASYNKNKLEIELAELTNKYKINSSKATGEELIIIEKELADKKREIDNNLNKDSELILKDLFNKSKKRIEDEKNLSKKAYDEELITLQKRFRDGEFNQDEYERKIDSLKRKYAVKSIKIQIDRIEKELKATELSVELQEYLEKQLYNLKISLSNAETDNYLSDIEKKKEAERKFAEFKSKQISKASEIIASSLNLDASNLNNFITQFVDGFGKGLEGTEKLIGVLEGVSSAISVAGDIGNAVFENNIANIDAEIQANDDKYSLLLAQVQNDDVQRALIEEEAEKKRQALEKKKRKEQEKQAKFNKATAITQIALNTAQAILGIWAQVPKFDFGVSAGLLTGFVSALGAAQLAAVLAQPIPKYAKGTDNHKGGLAVVGDGGKREVAVTPSGDIMITPNKSTLVDLPKGTQIYPDFNKYSIEQTDFSDMLKNASMIASVTMNDKKMQNYIDAQRVFDKQLLEEMQKNTKAVKESKSRLTLNVPKVDFSDFNYKNYYES